MHTCLDLQKSIRNELYTTKISEEKKTHVGRTFHFCWSEMFIRRILPSKRKLEPSGFLVSCFSELESFRKGGGDMISFEPICMWPKINANAQNNVDKIQVSCEHGKANWHKIVNPEVKLSSNGSLIPFRIRKIPLKRTLALTRNIETPMSEPVLAWLLLAQTLGLPILYASSVSTSTTTHGRLRSTQIMTISKKRLLIFVTSADRMSIAHLYVDREDEILTRIITDARSEMEMTLDLTSFIIVSVLALEALLSGWMINPWNVTERELACFKLICRSYRYVF